MDIFLYVSLVLCVVAFLFCVYMLNRNNRVAIRRLAMNEWSFRNGSWDEYNKYSYSEMVNSFWISVNSFYKDQLGK